LHLQIERSADSVLSPWVGWWGGGWQIAYSGITYDLDPYKEYWFRASNIRVNGELLDPERMYKVAGYWNLDDPDKINRITALQILTFLFVSFHGFSSFIIRYFNTFRTNTLFKKDVYLTYVSEKF